MTIFTKHQFSQNTTANYHTTKKSTKQRSLAVTKIVTRHGEKRTFRTAQKAATITPIAFALFKRCNWRENEATASATLAEFGNGRRTISFRESESGRERFRPKKINVDNEYVTKSLKALAIVRNNGRNVVGFRFAGRKSFENFAGKWFAWGFRMKF